MDASRGSEVILVIPTFIIYLFRRMYVLGHFCSISAFTKKSKSNCVTNLFSETHFLALSKNINLILSKVFFSLNKLVGIFNFCVWLKIKSVHRHPTTRLWISAALCLTIFTTLVQNVYFTPLIHK